MVSMKKYMCVILVLVCSLLSIHDITGMHKPVRNTVVIFAHGLGGNASQGESCKRLVNCEVIGVDGPEVKGGFFSSYLGQNGDIDVIVEQIEKQVQEGNDIVGFGTSKGAATWIHVIGWLAKNKSELLKFIKVLILDAPFASPESVSVKAFEQLEQVKKNGVTCEGKAISDLFKNYAPDGITPIKAVKEQWGQIKNKDMLIVLAHSKDDCLIKIEDSHLLCKAMVDHGFKPYFIQMSMGRHGQAFFDPFNKVVGKIQTVLVKHKMLHLFSEGFFKDQVPVVDDFGFSDPVNVFCDGGVIKNKDGKIKLSLQGDSWLNDMRPYLSGFGKFIETVKSFF